MTRDNTIQLAVANVAVFEEGADTVRDDINDGNPWVSGSTKDSGDFLNEFSKYGTKVPLRHNEFCAYEGGLSAGPHRHRPSRFLLSLRPSEACAVRPNRTLRPEIGP